MVFPMNIISYFKKRVKKSIFEVIAIWKSKFQRKSTSTGRRSFSACPPGNFSVPPWPWARRWVFTSCQEAASWLCILAAAPIAVTGFFRYNGLTFERFVWAFLKSQVLCAGPRVYRAENIYLQAMPEQRKIWGTGKKP